MTGYVVLENGPTGCIVLGNGPTLAADHRVKRGLFRIGVNRSYEVVPSHVVCTLEVEVAKKAHSQSGAFLILVKRNVLPPMHGVAYFDPPKWCGQSGAFAIWCAVELGFEEIYLLGFGGSGHFYGGDDVDRGYQEPNFYAAVRYARSQHRGVMIWESGGYRSMEVE